MTLSTGGMHPLNSSHIPKSSRRRHRSYSDAHVHFATTSQAAASATDAFSNNKINGIATYFDDNPKEGVTEERTISPAATSQHQYSGSRPRSKSESEPCHHRRIPHKKKYLHHQQRQHQHQHHLNYGRHSPPPLSSCGKMWIRPISARRGGMETHHVITSALGDRSLTFARAEGPPQVASNVPSANEEAAVTIGSNTTKTKTPRIDYYTGLEDYLTMKYTPSSPSPPTLFGSGYNNNNTTTSYSLLSHDSPTTPMAFGESGKPIVRLKNHHHEEDHDLFESGFLPVNPTNKKGGDVK